MNYFPLFVNLNFRSCAIIGNKFSGSDLLENLMQTNAGITVYTRFADKALKDKEQKGSLRVKKELSAEELLDYFIVFITSDEYGSVKKWENYLRDHKIITVKINGEIKEKNCNDYILPSIYSRGSLKLGITTGGVSKELENYLQYKLESYIGEEYEFFLRKSKEIISNTRTERKKKKLKKSGYEKIKIVESILSLICKGEIDYIDKWLEDLNEE